jgi:hypothetical protein
MGDLRMGERDPQTPPMNCIPTAVVPALIDGLLVKAGASAALRQKVATAANDLKYITGEVVAVATDAAKRNIAVAGMDNTGKPLQMASFKVPPNTKAMEDELLRAQNEGRRVSVVYSTDSQGDNILESLTVYAGVASPGPRY